MREYAFGSLAILVGFSILTVAITYSTNAESAQKVENIKTLYELKTTLQQRKDRQELQEFIDSTQIYIDSLENNK